jgi:hypothetical protein
MNRKAKDKTKSASTENNSMENNNSKKKNKKATANTKKTVSSKKAKSRTKDNVLLPKTAQDTVPYLRIYKSGIIETQPNFFTKAYQLQDINFSVAPEEDQVTIFDKYGELLNSFDASTKLQIVINNRNADENLMLQTVLSPMKQDGLDLYRQEMNEMIRGKMSEGRNNLVSDKYIVLGSHYENYIEAHNNFGHVDIDLNQKIKNVAQNQNIETPPMNINERLKSLHDILNIGKEDQFNININLDDVTAQGLTSKDIVAPAGFRFERDFIRMGDKFARVLLLKTLPSTLSTDFMQSIAELPFNMTASFYMEPIAQDKATSLVTRHLQNIRANVIDAEKSASKAGYSARLISPDLLHSEEQAQYLLDDMRSRDQKIFFFTGVVMHYADTKEELDKDTQSILSMGNRYIVTFETLLFQQEQGFRNALPLCRNDLFAKRLLTTECASLFIPFSTKELIQQHGMYYGLNAVSKNLLLFNRLNSKNQNGLILGQPGSGKSFSAKREMINVFLNTDDELYIIDPESEYTYMAKCLGGSVVHLEAGAKVYINPFDMDLQYGDDEGSNGTDPVTMKSDYICMLCETVMGGRYEITNIQKSIIDRCVIELYKPYMGHMRNMPKGVTCDKSASPTMNDFYELLMRQPEPEAQNIALSLEIYCRGSLDTFAHRTNVDVDNRLTVYDIKDIGSGMKELGLQVCLNHVWNKIIENQSKGKRTWFYIDEFHILTKTRSSSEFLEQVWKRARKWGGVPTAITQNVGDLFKTDASMAIINNCEFIMMLSQSPSDRLSLAEMYHISDAQLNYITNSPPGQGLLYTGETIVPFVDHFPKDTELYKIMSSKADERKIG